MIKSQLAPEVISLIHHVELNQSGWWKKAVAQVIRGVLWSQKGPVSARDLKGALAASGVDIQLEFVDRQLEQLRSSSQAISLPDGKWKLTEKTLSELNELHAAAFAESEQCRELFEIECKAHCPTLDSSEVWHTFISELTAAIHGIGANTYHLLTDGALERDPDWLERFTTAFDIGQLDGLRRVMGHFFATSNLPARRYLLRILAGYFFAEATRLTPETLRLIDKGRAKRSIKIVLDTNFIFSILGLHDNPANEAAIDLVSLAETSGKNLDIRLYVLPGTIDEATRVLVAQEQSIDRIRTSRAVSGAALNAPLSGIAARFFQAANKAPGLTTQMFFDPYINGLKQILSTKGVAVLDAHPTIYNTRQSVIDDVLEQTDWEHRNLNKDRQKSYETWLHDVVLWHVINDHRSSADNSPFDVEYWAVSIDWRLINFDRIKRDRFKLPVPTVLHPTNLIQLLQFWLPRSETLEATLVDSLRIPLFFRDFDPDDERATLRILQALSRYENLDDLPASAIPPLLANQALRNRLKEGDVADDQMLTMVREELLAEHNKALDSLAKKEAALNKVESDLQQALSSANVAAGEIKEAHSVKQKLADDLETTARKLRAAEVAQQRLTDEKNELILNSRKIGFGIRYVALPIAIAVALALLVHFYLLPTVQDLKQWQKVVAILTTTTASIVGGIYASQFYLRRHLDLSQWWPARLYVWMYKRLVLGGVALTFSGIWQGGIWDGVKKILGIS